MRNTLIIIAVLVQFLVLGWMAGQREWIVRTGPTVWLRTAPVDPRDLFRGDYVTLGYDISSIAAEKYGPGLKGHLEKLARRHPEYAYGYRREIVVFAALKVDAGSGIADIATVDLTPPPSGLFIKGRARVHRGSNDLQGVSYGIDAYFIQQGKGGELERRAPAGVPDGIQAPMEMLVALGRDGTAVLKNHRWGPLGIGMRIEKRDGSPASKGAPDELKVIRVTLGNVAHTTLAVVLPPDLRTFRIQSPEGWNGPANEVGVPRTGLPPLTDADVRVLKPGETTTVMIDPASPEWFVKTDADVLPQPIGNRRDDYRSFRLVYEAPAAEACQGLKDAALIVRALPVGRRFSPYEFREN